MFNHEWTDERECDRSTYLYRRIYTHSTQHRQQLPRELHNHYHRGGSRDGSGSGNNLFHSFSTFNIESGATVTFTDPGVSNIFSRITDTNALNTSNINGTLKVSGDANLFLVNPNGIIFDQDARLEMKGSLISGTAERIRFENNASFSTTDSTLPSLLTINVPTGLQFGATSSPITVQGSEQRFSYVSNGLVSQNSAPLASHDR